MQFDDVEASLWREEYVVPKWVFTKVSYWAIWKRTNVIPSTTCVVWILLHDKLVTKYNLEHIGMYNTTEKKYLWNKN